MVGYFDLDLPQDRDDMPGTVLLPRHAPAPLVPVSLTFALVHNLPVTSPGYTEELLTNQYGYPVLRVPALFLFGPIRQARVSGSYCLIIVAGDPKTTE